MNRLFNRLFNGLYNGLFGILCVVVVLSSPLQAQQIAEKKLRIAKLPTTGYSLRLNIPTKEVKKDWKHFLSQIATPRISHRHWKVYFGEKPYALVLYTTLEKHEQHTLVYLGIHTRDLSSEKATHYHKEIKGLLEKFSVVAMKQHLEQQLIAYEKDIRKSSYARERLQQKIKKLRGYMDKHPDTPKTAAYAAEIKALRADIQRLSQRLEATRGQKAKLVAGLTALGN